MLALTDFIIVFILIFSLLAVLLLFPCSFLIHWFATRSDDGTINAKSDCFRLGRKLSKYRQTRAWRERSQMLCNGAPARQEIGLAQSERAASRPDLPTHWAQNEHAAAQRARISTLMQKQLNNRESLCISVRRRDGNCQTKGLKHSIQIYRYLLFIAPVANKIVGWNLEQDLAHMGKPSCCWRRGDGEGGKYRKRREIDIINAIQIINQVAG